MRSFVLDVGSLDRPIVIEAATTVQDTFGEGIRTWATHARLNANVKVESGSESQMVDQEVARTTAVFLIRYKATISPEMRIVWDSRTWDIELIRQLGRQQAMQIRATARV